MERWEDAILLLKELVNNREGTIQNRLLLGQLQLQGIREPKAAQINLSILANPTFSYASNDGSTVRFRGVSHFTKNVIRLPEKCLNRLPTE